MAETLGKAVRKQLAQLLGTCGVRYVGREENSSPANGSKKKHDAEQARLVNEAFAAN